MTPTLHLTNWSSRRLHGPGRRFTIMLHPNGARGQWGEGRVNALTPPPDSSPLLSALIEDRRQWRPVDPIVLAAYREMCEAKFAGANLAPGRLEVADGDTLCCACSVAEARAGRCHRSWAAPFLVRAGWRVVLDGEEVRL